MEEIFGDDKVSLKLMSAFTNEIWSIVREPIDEKFSQYGTNFTLPIELELVPNNRDLETESESDKIDLLDDKFPEYKHPFMLLVTPIEKVENKEYTIKDIFDIDVLVEGTTADDKDYLRDYHEPMAFLYYPYIENNTLHQRIIFFIPISNYFHDEIIVELFDNKENIINQIQESFTNKISKNLVEDRYIVKLDNILMKITDKNTNIITEIKENISVETYPACLYITVDIKYIDEKSLRPGEKEMLKASKRFKNQISKV